MVQIPGKKLVLATQNPKKLRELRELLGSDIEVLCLADFPELSFDWVENGKTFQDNAGIKIQAIRQKIKNFAILSDDSGLCVKALDDAPGVYSARYGGENSTDEKNNILLLRNMEGVPRVERSAYFVCVIAYFCPERNETFFFEGKCQGNIIKEQRGNEGFGYDPVFEPEGYSKTFAELGKSVKSKLSHRYLALQAWQAFLS